MNINIAIFSIMDGMKKALTVYLIHSLALKMSAIQVFVKDKMAVVAHLVHIDDVRKSFFNDSDFNSENSSGPWRAMLIKDNDGDWGICVATWAGMKAGRPGVVGMIMGNPGYCKLIFKSLRTKMTQTLYLPSKLDFVTKNRKTIWCAKGHYNFSVFDACPMYVDLEKGYMVLHPETEDAVQQVALAFATSMLYLMVQPVPPASALLKVSPISLENSDVEFFVHCGYKILKNIPTNTNLRDKFEYERRHEYLHSGNGGVDGGGGCGSCGGCGGGGCGGGL